MGMSEHSSSDRTEAIQAVVDRVASYQDGAPEGTVEVELGKALAETDVSLEDHEVTALAEAIESEHGDVSAAEVLGR